MSELALLEAPSERPVVGQKHLSFDKRVEDVQVQKTKPFLRWAGGKTRRTQGL